jgi:hypothetical protein
VVSLWLDSSCVTPSWLVPVWHPSVFSSSVVELFILLDFLGVTLSFRFFGSIIVDAVKYKYKKQAQSSSVWFLQDGGGGGGVSSAVKDGVAIFWSVVTVCIWSPRCVHSFSILSPTAKQVCLNKSLKSSIQFNVITLL